MNDSKPKVFCIGLSRSGTTSLHHILGQLGFKSVHFCEFLLSDNPNLTDCEAFDALGDSPIPAYYKELDRIFPNAKFILTIRDRNEWLRSMKWMFKCGKVIWDWGPEVHAYHKRFYGTRSYRKSILEKHWEDYHAGVLNHFSHRPNQLFVVRLETGFNMRELCTFLGVPHKDVEVQSRNRRVKVSWVKRLKYFGDYSYQRAKGRFGAR